MTGITFSAGSKGTDQVTGLKLSPSNRIGDLGKAHGAVARSGGVKSHGDETRAVRSVAGTLLVGVSGIHGVRDLLGDPILATGDDFLAADHAVDAAAPATTTRATAGDIVACAGLDVVISNIAPSIGLVPESIAVD